MCVFLVAKTFLIPHLSTHIHDWLGNCWAFQNSVFAIKRSVFLHAMAFWSLLRTHLQSIDKHHPLGLRYKQNSHIYSWNNQPARKSPGANTTTSTIAENLLVVQQYLRQKSEPVRRQETPFIERRTDGTSEAKRLFHPKWWTRQRIKTSDEGRRRLSRTSTDIRIGS